MRWLCYIVGHKWEHQREWNRQFGDEDVYDMCSRCLKTRDFTF